MLSTLLGVSRNTHDMVAASGDDLLPAIPAHQQTDLFGCWASTDLLRAHEAADIAELASRAPQGIKFPFVITDHWRRSIGEELVILLMIKSQRIGKYHQKSSYSNDFIYFPSNSDLFNLGSIDLNFQSHYISKFAKIFFSDSDLRWRI